MEILPAGRGVFQYQFGWRNAPFSRAANPSCMTNDMTQHTSRMKSRECRGLACVLVVAAIGLSVASRKKFFVNPGDKASGSETTSRVLRSKVAERSNIDGDTIREIPTDTSRLKREASALLDGLDELEKVINMIEEASQLSEIFREWGQSDFEGARRFLETEKFAKKLLDPDRTIADELFLAALIGYSERDPVDAWEVFLSTQDYSDRPLILNLAKKPYSHAVAAEQIIRTLFRKSEKTALRSLREIDPKHRFLVAPALRGILAEMADERHRREVLAEFLGSTPQGSRTDAGIVCAGLAEHDPGLAWESLQKWVQTQDMISSDHPESYFGRDFIESWSRRQPDEALNFIAAMEDDDLQSDLWASFATVQTQFRPGLIVKALEMDSLSRFQAVFRPEILVQLMDREIPWPLLDENVPLQRDLQFAELKHAVESSRFPETLKLRFLNSIESETSK